MTTPNTIPSDLDREALEPCPFCGGEPYMLAHTDTKDGFVHCYSIRCDVYGIEIGDEYESETLASWNRRVLPRASGVPEAEVMRLRREAFMAGVAWQKEMAAPEADAVAWRWRAQMTESKWTKDKWTTWVLWDKEPIVGQNLTDDAIVEIEPLFASPPPVAAPSGAKP